MLLNEINRLINIDKNVPNQQNNSNSNNEERECCICFDNEKNTVCVPCGHRAMCKQCVTNYDNSNGCPICRKEISMIIDLFE